MTALVSLAFGLLYTIVGFVGLVKVGADPVAVGMTVVGMTFLAAAGILVRHAVVLVRGPRAPR
jgi:hypothetical protein